MEVLYFSVVSSIFFPLVSINVPFPEILSIMPYIFGNTVGNRPNGSLHFLEGFLTNFYSSCCQ
jgi:hypothetical protein